MTDPAPTSHAILLALIEDVEATRKASDVMRRRGEAVHVLTTQGVTISGIARACNVSRSTVQNWAAWYIERGKPWPLDDVQMRRMVEHHLGPWPSA